MTGTEAFLDNVIARLNSGIVDSVASVDKWPNKPSASKFTHPKAAIWVGYQGSQFGQPRATDLPVQDRALSFDIGVLVRNLNGPHGATAYLDAVRGLLHGYCLPSGGTAIAMIDERFLDHKDGVWRYGLVCSTKLPAVPAVAAETAPQFVKATFEAAVDGEDFEVTAPADPEEP